jgi:protein subunit release factor A
MKSGFLMIVPIYARVRILDAQQQAQQKEQASTRKELVGSGDRSQRIKSPSG